jgi:hypothetical protein
VVRKDVRPIRTCGDLIHAVANALSVISSHSQHLLGKRPLDQGASGEREGLEVIYEEAERACRLLGRLPSGVAKLPVAGAAGMGPRPARAPRGAKGAGHGQGR